MSWLIYVEEHSVWEEMSWMQKYDLQHKSFKHNEMYRDFYDKYSPLFQINSTLVHLNYVNLTRTNVLSIARVNEEGAKVCVLVSLWFIQHNVSAVELLYSLTWIDLRVWLTRMCIEMFIWLCESWRNSRICHMSFWNVRE